MLGCIAVTIFGLATAQDTVADDPGQELAALLATAARVESYAFESVSETEREGGDGPGAGGGRFGGEPQPVRGVYKKGLPLQVRSGEHVAFKDGELVVIKNEEGKWELMDAQVGFGRGGRGGEGGDERGGRAGGFAGMRALFALTRTVAPHQQLADLTGLTASCAKRVVTATEGTPERTYYSGKLTEAGARSLGERSGFRGRRGGGPELTYEGKYEVEVTAGAITAATFEITRSGSMDGESSFVITTTQKTSLDEIGAAELEVPAEALALFEV